MKIGVYGSCHALAAQRYFRQVVSDHTLDIAKLAPYYELNDEEIELFKKRTLPSLDFFLYQPISENARGSRFCTAALLREVSARTRTLRFSYAHFELYNPYSVSRLDMLPDTDLAYMDYAVGALVMNGVKGSSLVSLYEQGPDFSPYKDALLAFSLAELRDREMRTLPEDKAVDICSSEYIADNFQGNRLFLSMNHPSNILLKNIFGKMATQMGLTVDDTLIMSELLEDTVIPIPNYIKDVYELNFFIDNTKLKLGNNSLNLPEYIKRYEDYFRQIKPDIVRSCVENLAISRPWFQALLEFGR